MSFFNREKEILDMEYKFPMLEMKEREVFFISLDALTSQAEYHFLNKNFELSEGIFELMIKHIEKNKSIRFVDNQESFIDIAVKKKRAKNYRQAVKEKKLQMNKIKSEAIMNTFNNPEDVK
jgi:hypothetical protein